MNYINGLARFADPHTIEYTEKGKDEVKRVTAAHIVIAVGGRPHVPADVPGAKEHAITSDDIFSLNRRPGKTLCVGASYIALECAGFLTELGYDVTVAARSILLRGFDRQCADKIGALMEDLGTTIMVGYQPTAITKLPSGKLQVVFSDVGGSGAQKIEQYDTIFFATGRTPDLAGLNLPAAGVQVAPSGKLPVADECTNVPHIFAVGDVCEGKQELTPVAVRAGELLAKRLFGGATERMDYDLVATTVFTPLEYGTVGLSEEDAVAKYGEDDLEVPHTASPGHVSPTRPLLSRPRQPPPLVNAPHLGVHVRVHDPGTVGHAPDEAPEARRGRGHGQPVSVQARVPKERGRAGRGVPLRRPERRRDHAGVCAGGAVGRQEGRLRLDGRHPPHRRRVLLLAGRHAALGQELGGGRWLRRRRMRLKLLGGGKNQEQMRLVGNG